MTTKPLPSYFVGDQEPFRASDTPRTDEVACYCERVTPHGMVRGQYVPVEFARTLERETSAGAAAGYTVVFLILLALLAGCVVGHCFL